MKRYVHLIAPALMPDEEIMTFQTSLWEEMLLSGIRRTETDLETVVCEVGYATEPVRQ